LKFELAENPGFVKNLFPPVSLVCGFLWFI
jgi:hypothetical protein